MCHSGRFTDCRILLCRSKSLSSACDYRQFYQALSSHKIVVIIYIFFSHKVVVSLEIHIHHIHLGCSRLFGRLVVSFFNFVKENWSPVKSPSSGNSHNLTQ